MTVRKQKRSVSRSDL